jgi:2-isopropylmalate synthase
VDIGKTFAEFKALCDKKKVVYDDDILALVTEDSRKGADLFELIELQCESSSKGTPRAEVTMRVDGVEKHGSATGDGVVDASYKAIYKLAGMTPALERYTVKSITGGTDALGEVSCLVRDEGMTVAGHGAHSDIVMASAMALVNALNRLKIRSRASESPRLTGP